MTDRPDDRAQAITLNYTIGLAIGVLLVTGLLIAGGNFVQDQREDAIRTELRVIGQQVAADFATADRLAQSAESNSTVTLRRSMPGTVAGSTYSVELVESENPELVLTSADPEVEVTVGLANESAVAGTSISGGNIQVNETKTGALTLESGGGDG